MYSCLSVLPLGLSEIVIDGQVAEDWTIFPIELKKEFIET